MRQLLALLTFNLLGLISMFGNNFPVDFWQVQSYSASAGDYQINFYHQDSTNNTESYEGIVYEFAQSGDYNVYSSDTINRISDWQIYSNGDSIKLGSQKYAIETFTESKVVLRFTGKTYGVLLDYKFELIPMPILSFKNSKAEKFINISPMPTNGKLVLNLNNTEIRQAFIYDLNGREIEEISLDTSNHQVLFLDENLEGIYFIHFLSESGVLIERQKIIIL